jgi:AmmeMemoRadiSam system protein A
MSFDSAQRLELLHLARDSIVSGLRERRRTPCIHTYSSRLEVPRASFVTLRVGAQLRGCCGSIDARRPIAEDVWVNAWSSAFNDPRFAPLTFSEYPSCSVHISVLSELEPIAIASEQALVAALQRQVDGLLLREGARQATFLPAVWDQITDPSAFVRQLKEKAGWPATYWSADIEAYRYTTESFGDEDAPDVLPRETRQG